MKTIIILKVMLGIAHIEISEDFIVTYFYIDSDSLTPQNISVLHIKEKGLYHVNFDKKSFVRSDWSSIKSNGAYITSNTKQILKFIKI